MPRGKRTTQASASAELGAFLRSINVQLDACDPSRIAHFRPTGKAVLLLDRLFASSAKAVLVTAPYGSGKSLTATYALNLVENRKEAKPVLKGIAERLDEVSGPIGEFAQARSRSSKRGIGIALQGHVGSLRDAIHEGFQASLSRHGVAKSVSAKLKRQFEKADGEVVETIRLIVETASEIGFDEVFLAWDEFGRHLESLIANGRPSELHDVQQLAELAVRSRGVPFRFCVLLHQGVQVYASAAPESVRREWRKIEERFERIDYVDDSKEMLRLLADLVAAAPGRLQKAPSQARLREYAKGLLGLGLFKEFKIAELAKMLGRVYPLDGVALYLLPRVSARVAQNERTLFNFLQSVTWDAPVTAAHLYRFFELAMRQDSGPGGTYRAMLETNSAVSKCVSELEVSILQSACSLSIGLSGNRTKISRDLLLAAASGTFESPEACEQAVDSLIERKLLLYRRHSDEVSVWHGTDLNLRDRVEETRRLVEADFDLVSFLEREWPLPSVRATEHNDKHRIRRYFERFYRLPEAIEGDAFAETLGGMELRGDGLILHTLPVADDAARDEVFKTAQAVTKNSGGRVIVTVPMKPIALEQAAVELAAILRLQRDRTLLDEDPLVGEELRQMEDDARIHLQRLLDRVVSPSPHAEMEFVVNGRRRDVASASEVRRLVSDACDRLFPDTPRLPNEQVNRRKPSAVIVNARKKLLSAILEGTGKPDFGFNDPDFQRELGSATLAQYRSVVKNTGLYREVAGDRWGFAPPSAIEDPGLAKVWELLRDFFTSPDEQAKPLETLFTALAGPPFGLRAGVLPILMACAVRAFPVAGALIQDGMYASDIRPTTIEDLCRDPRRFELRVTEVSDSRRQLLEGVCDLFRGRQVAAIDDPDLVRRAYELIQMWKAESPDCIRIGTGLSEKAEKVRRALWSSADPLTVLFDEIPSAVEIEPAKCKALLKGIASAKEEMESLVGRYVLKAWQAMAAGVGGNSSCSSPETGASELRAWAESLPLEALDQASDPRVKGVVSHFLDDSSSPERTAVAVTARITKSVHRWDDAEATRFADQFRRLVEVAEEAALQAVMAGAEVSRGTRDRLASMVERRLERNLEILNQLVGSQKAAKRVQSMAKPRRVMEPVAREDLFNG